MWGKTSNLILCGLLIVPLSSFAEKSGFYVGGHIGAAQVESDTKAFSSTTVNGFHHPYGYSDDVDFAGGVAIGYDLEPKYNIPARVELNYTDRNELKTKKDLDTVNPLYKSTLAENVDMDTLMFNLWADIPISNTKLKPYVGGGIGVAFIDYKIDNGEYLRSTGGRTGIYDSGSKSTTNFAWNLGGGIAYDITENFTADLGYRYVDGGKVKIDHLNSRGMKTVTKPASNEVFFGLRVNFK